MTGWLAKLGLKQKAIILGVGLVAAAILIYFWIIAPQRQHINTLLAQYQTERQRIQTIEVYAQKHPDPGQHVREVDLKVAQVEAKLPNQPEIGEFLKEVEQAAKISGVRLSEIKPSAPVNKNGYREIPVEIQIRGSFNSLLEFMNKIENSQRFNSTSNANIQVRQGMLEVRLTLAIYSYGVSPEAAQQQTAKSPPVKK
ncbi:type 4a pilus biogenesis protein PilO [Sporomusa sp.]|uniref:type 4a pilus biogenesis protein PilO n=1 Tax=Sporomusa sp. TaxID=2078658 RepID=UPI002C90B6C8|nr:type 4a pilus biogenesis protein PilO [Sporomusa sp.]HWR43643.1 type 4a pilus biogenesis protein PilO [Sporomusa sp.]